MDSKKILLAIDDSDSSWRALEYVGQMLNSFPGFQVTVTHVIDYPPDDYFENQKAREEFIAEKQAKTRDLLEKARDRLMAHGLDPARIDLKAPVKSCPTMAGCLLEQQKKIDAGTIVVGRRGISRSEEFMFGSVSSKIIHYARHCTIWVVE